MAGADDGNAGFELSGESSDAGLEETRAMRERLGDFRAEWDAGRRPGIEKYLADFGDRAKPRLFRHLLREELLRRRENGEEPKLEDYVQRFPDYKGIIDDELKRPASTANAEAPDACHDQLDAISKLRLGEVFAGRYRIESKLGEGGYGTVYLAHDKTANCKVAVKIPNLRKLRQEKWLSADRARQIVAAFLSEARTMQALDHRGIVRVLDAPATTPLAATNERSAGDLGDLADVPLEQCFVVLEYMPGGSVAKALKDGRKFTEMEAASLVAKVADAVAYLHQEDYIHRDITPANILLDDEGNPRLADFGLALHENQFCTAARTGAGTPGFAPPEQWQGNSFWRGDVLSLGAVLYWLLCARPPFQGVDAKAIVHATIHGHPKPLPQEIPSRLRDICSKALKKSPEDRYQSAGDMAKALRQWLRDHPSHRFDEEFRLHETFIGRTSAIEAVRRFIDDHDHGLLLITGSPGKGKSALAAHLAREVFKGQKFRPVSFFYRCEGYSDLGRGLTHPVSFFAHVNEELAEIHGLATADERPRDYDEGKQRLTALLGSPELATALSQERAAKRRAAQVLIVDGLDEAVARDKGGTAFDALPSVLPAGVYVIALTRPCKDALDVLDRRENVERLDLDAETNERVENDHRDGVEYLKRQLADNRAVTPELIGEIATAADGNFIILTHLAARLTNDPDPEKFRKLLEEMRDLNAHKRLARFYEDCWHRILDGRAADDEDAIYKVAGALAFAHADLSQEIIRKALNINRTAFRRAIAALTEVLHVGDREREDGRFEPVYRLFYESFRKFVRAERAGDKRRLKKALARYCRARFRHMATDSFKDLTGYAAEYVIRFGATHLREAKRWKDLENLLMDYRFLEAKTEAGLVFQLRDDFEQALESLPTGSPNAHVLQALLDPLRLYTGFIARHAGRGNQELYYPQALFQCLWNSGMWHSHEPTRGACPVGGCTLVELLEHWRAEKQKSLGFVWLRSLSVPPEPIGSPLQAVIGAGSPGACARNAPLVVASNGRRFSTWNINSGTLHKDFEGHEDDIRFLAFSPDDRRIMSGSKDQTARIWDLASKRQPLVLRHDDAVQHVAFLSGDRAVTATSGKLFTWDARSGERINTENIDDWVADTIAWSPKDLGFGAVVTKRDDGLAFFELDLSRGTLMRRSVVPMDSSVGLLKFSVPRLAWLVDGKHLAVRDVLSVRVLDVESGELRCLSDDWLCNICAVDQGLAIAERTGKVRIYRRVAHGGDGDPNDGVLSFEIGDKGVEALSYHAGRGRWGLLVGFFESATHVWSVQKVETSAKRGVMTLRRRQISADDIIRSPDGERIAAATKDACAVWHARTRRNASFTSRLLNRVAPVVGFKERCERDNGVELQFASFMAIHQERKRALGRVLSAMMPWGRGNGNSDEVRDGRQSRPTPRSRQIAFFRLWPPESD